MSAAVLSLFEWSGIGPVEVQNWPVVNNVGHAFMLLAAYYVTVWILTEIMKRKKEPFQLKLYSQVHNACMVVLSLYMGLEYTRLIFADQLKIYGNEIGSDDKYIPHAQIQWIFMLSKIPEWNDTFIMILKKNFHQVSILHLYHHGSIFMFSFLAMTQIPGGDCWLAAWINSWIHVIMYSYYFCAPLARDTKNPIIKAIVSFKRLITIGQLVQFIVIFSRDCYVLFSHYALGQPWNNSCGPIFMYWTELAYMITMVGLFANFYINSYSKKPTSEKKSE
jgi:hypothetical protein